MEETMMGGIGRELGEVAKSIFNGLADNKLSITEDIEIGKELIQMLMFAIANRTDILKCLKDGIDENEEAELRAGFAAAFDIVDDVTEATVERLVDASLMIVTGLSTFVDVAVDIHNAKTKQEQTVHAASEGAPYIPGQEAHASVIE